jgi:small subunit ribosomal protein S29
MGVNDPDRAWPIFQVFWREITKENSTINVENAGRRPPVLMCLDNMAHVMQNSKYQILNEAGKLTPIHAHDLVLVKHFFNQLSGASSLPNGGMVLAATSASDAPNSEAMDVGIAMAETRQNIASDVAQSRKQTTPYSTPYTSLQKLSPDKDPDPTALSNFWSPFRQIDTRVLDVFKDIEVVRLSGMDYDEAASLMQYWTRSGMYRGTVSPEIVEEARGLSGGGVVGQLELAVVGFLQRERGVVEGEAGGKKGRIH